MIDANGVEIKADDIVKYENSKTDEVRYYIADTDDFNYLRLYLYDNKGRIDREGLGNIRLGNGVSLINDQINKWIVLGTKDEVYNKLFEENR